MLSRVRMTGYSVGVKQEDKLQPRSANHCTKVNSKTASMIKTAGLKRVAGNVYINLSTRDLWSVKGNKLMRLTGIEVDNGESMKINISNPEEALADIMGDLTF